MVQLLRSNDRVLISFVIVLLKEAGIYHTVLDQHMSAMEGSILAIPQRILVARDDHPRAKRILGEAGLAAELT